MMKIRKLSIWQRFFNISGVKDLSTIIALCSMVGTLNAQTVSGTVTRIDKSDNTYIEIGEIKGILQRKSTCFLLS